MKITALIENSIAPGHSHLRAEFGLSLHVEHRGRRVLFDTGTSGAFADNASKLGIAMEDVDVAVLSHHHFDHGGGLTRFFELNSRAKLYLRESAPATRWFRAFAVVRRRIGIDTKLLKAHEDRLVPIRKQEEILPGVHLLTDLDQGFPKPRGNRHLWMKREGRMTRDPFDHELEMVVEGEEGLVVISGCSHNGILNMVETARRRFPDRPLAAVIGGFHLMGLPGTMAGSRRDVEGIGEALLRFEPAMVHTGHCTGAKGYRILAEVMGDTLRPLATGSVLEIR